MGIQGKANLLMVIVTMFWGLSYTFMVMGLETMAVYNVVALRCIIAFLAAGIIFYKRIIKVDAKTLKYAAIQGFLLFIVFALSLIGLETTSVSNAGFILSLTVVLVPIFSSFIEKKLPSKAVSFAIVCTMIGITILTTHGSVSFQKGDIVVAIAALCYSIYLLLNSSFTKNVESISYGIYQLGFAGLYALILTFIFETPTLPSTTTAWIAIIGLGVICSAFCFVGQTVAQQYTSATHTGLIFSLEPIFAAMFAMMFIGEGITIKLLIGGSFILIGNLVAQLEHLHVLRFIKKQEHEKAIH
ncbi:MULTISPECIES: DMT family transporter [Lysinibacillus]|uniref:DMT family transporter n=1 Tax=Lysinibacillus TaxID=400634 RepID=UPI00083C9D7C|nr:MULTISPECIES: DMT family transporter [Lysinibacillus]